MEENFKLILNELQKINTRLENLETGQKQLETGQKQLEAGQKQLESGQKQLEAGQKQLEEGQIKLHLDVIEIKNGQEKLQKNLIQSLGDYNEKMIQYPDDKTSALNKRIFRVETEIEKLLRQ
ncbi:TolC family protein [Bacillus sp. X1(2014)]|uniref:TolC family protein n=1 Tax=Bacillus sp. X1(2014) TaxID=1565991 RepID=UPI0011A80FC8|nr:TolC family protein [Bacillus sp. X1(2014)]